MERAGVLIGMMVLSLCGFGQFSKSRQVTFRAQATLAPGFLLGEGGGVLNVVGDAEYFLDNNASVRFDGSYYLLSFVSEPVFEMNHGVYVGMCFRPTLRGFAPFVGLQPGLHLTKLPDTGPSEVQPVQLSPVISGITGFNWYLINFLHVSMGMRLLHGVTFKAFEANGHPPISLTEMRGWLGLGFQITTKRRKFEDY